MQNFAIALDPFVFVPDIWNYHEFVNEYGTWNISITSSNNTFSGFMILKPAFEIDLASIAKLINVKFIFQNTSSASHNYEKEAIYNDGFVFNFDSFFSSGLSERHHDHQITVEIKVPICPQTKTSRGHFLELFLTEKFADVTIKSRDNEFKVHKFILARSEVFDAMLSNPETQESQIGIIKINDIKHEVLYEMCRFLYIDEIPVIEEIALDLLIAADKYNIPGLAARCGEYLMENMGDECYYDVLVVADKLNIKELKETAIDYVIDNRKTIFSSEGWKNLKKNNVPLAMEVLEKFVSDA